MLNKYLVTTSEYKFRINSHVMEMLEIIDGIMD